MDDSDLSSELQDRLADRRTGDAEGTLESAGFTDTEIRDVPDTRFQLVVGRKPT